jgi:stage V sporulation protein R
MARKNVELFLDSCHALDELRGGSLQASRAAVAGRRETAPAGAGSLFAIAAQRSVAHGADQAERSGGGSEAALPDAEPQENLLYFIEKERAAAGTVAARIVRIVRKIGQYFYPQRQTQVMNEGWATFFHYTLMNRLYDEGYVNDGL